MSFGGRQYFTFGTTEADRVELRRLCKERDEKLRAAGMSLKTIITDKEMQDRVRFGLDCRQYVTLADFKKRVALENQHFVHRRQTLTQEIKDKETLDLFNASADNCVKDESASTTLVGSNGILPDSV